MDYGGGDWNMVPLPQVVQNYNTLISNSQHIQLQQQQQQQQQQPHQPQQPQQQQQNHPHQSLASHFHILNHVENLAEAVESGTRDQHSDALVHELSNQFEKCQQLLNSISGSINVKSVTVERQKRRLEETERLLNERRDLMTEFRETVEDLLNSDNNR